MQHKNSLSFGSILKTTAIVSSPSLIVLALYATTDKLNFDYFIYAYIAILLISLVYILPFLYNIYTLNKYVDDLAQDKKVRPPTLGFLSNVASLSESLGKLQISWESKRKEMETIMNEREILVDTLPDILIMLNDKNEIIRTNRAARAIFGQNLGGKPLKDAIESDRLISAISRVVEDLHGEKIEFFISEPTPRDFQAIIERFPIPSEGGISIIITMTDITEQKRVQRMRADFVANASHEIRTPLASIIGFIETLRGPAKDDAGARDEFLRVMGDQAERMSKLVNDLLSLSKIEMNSHTTPTGKVDLVSIIRKEKPHFEWPCKQKNVTMRYIFNDNLPAIKGDDDEIAQVVRNLLGNAIKYTSPDTEIVVTVKISSNLPKDPNLRNLSRAILFSVQDHGEGIPKEHIPRLTERFYRVDSARTRKVGGTGLGLAIVKHVLNRHHGALVVESEVGEGSTFSVYLPIYEDTEKENAKGSGI